MAVFWVNLVGCFFLIFTHQSDVLSCEPTNNVKAMKETRSNDPSLWPGHILYSFTPELILTEWPLLPIHKLTSSNVTLASVVLYLLVLEVSSLWNFLLHLRVSLTHAFDILLVELVCNEEFVCILVVLKFVCFTCLNSLYLYYQGCYY